MNEEEGFLQAIRENLDDDVARSVYADWLEERGDPRGEYLRLEVQLPRLKARVKELQGQLDASWVLAVSKKRDVVLVSFPPPMKINTIMFVRQLTGCGLKEAKDLVEAPPAIILRAVSLEQALQVQGRFSDSCQAEVRLDPPT